MYSARQNSISQRLVQKQNNGYVRQYNYLLVIYISLFPKIEWKKRHHLMNENDTHLIFYPWGWLSFFTYQVDKNAISTQNDCQIYKLERLV